jgi:hypothetical protein
LLLSLRLLLLRSLLGLERHRRVRQVMRIH